MIMSLQQLHCPNLAALPETVRQVMALAKANNCQCITLKGTLGAGKTTFVQAFARQLQVSDTVQSPSFGIVNEYRLPDGGALYHFDCYRLKNLEEAYQIGVEEYFDTAEWCLIEWPDVVEPLLPTPYLEIQINPSDGEERTFSLLIHE